MSAHAHAAPRPVGGSFFSPGILALAALTGLAGLLILWRFVSGLGVTTALNDGYPWGLWIAFDVVTGTALACGGYAMAILVYIRNKGEYHPLVRPALVTSAFGYSIAGFSVLLDVGRPYLIWKIPLFFWSWNFDSVLLEVALCIMAYTFVLWLELSPAFLEGAKASGNPRWRAIGEAWLPVARKSLLWLIALGMLLPTMHQSSLGSLMLLSGPRLHPLWNTPFLPLLFLISCIGMGYGAVVMEGALSMKFLGRKPETAMLGGIGAIVWKILAAYLALRIGDLAWRGQLGALFAFDTFSVMSLLELALFVGAIALLVGERGRRDIGTLFRAAMLVILAGGLYRFDVFLLAFRPGDHWSYFPSVPETMITVGLVAGEILGYIILIKLFPILAGEPAPVRPRSVAPDAALAR
jgi:Ni/Fe-hydrogenase subunit HybB-like protein